MKLSINRQPEGKGIMKKTITKKHLVTAQKKEESEIEKLKREKDLESDDADGPVSRYAVFSHKKAKGT